MKVAIQVSGKVGERFSVFMRMLEEFLTTHNNIKLLETKDSTPLQNGFIGLSKEFVVNWKRLP